MVGRGGRGHKTLNTSDNGEIDKKLYQVRVDRIVSGTTSIREFLSSDATVWAIRAQKTFRAKEDAMITCCHNTHTQTCYNTHACPCCHITHTHACTMVDTQLLLGYVGCQKKLRVANQLNVNSRLRKKHVLQRAVGYAKSITSQSN